jgi:hypothetical protein
MPNKFDANLIKLYKFYFEETEGDRNQKIKIFIDISALVKIVEEKFLATEMLIEKGNFEKPEKIRIGEAKQKWHELKEHNFNNPTFKSDNLKSMRELLENIFYGYMQFESLPAEINLIEGDDK